MLNVCFAKRFIDLHKRQAIQSSVNATINIKILTSYSFDHRNGFVIDSGLRFRNLCCPR